MRPASHGSGNCRRADCVCDLSHCAVSQAQSLPRGAAYPGQELAARLASEDASKVLIVDVRSHGYYDSGGERIKGSIRIEPNI